jgi:anthranilate phosphoribosyltransferase
MVRASVVRPEDFGVPRATIGDLRGGDREENAAIIRRILDGEPGARRDMVLVNAGAALVAGGRARDFKEGAQLAGHSIDTGAARGKLEALVSLSRELAPEKA